MQPLKLINPANGDEFVAITRAWWLEAALDSGNGRIEVARIDGRSTTLRRPSAGQLDADPTLNRYHGSADNQGDPLYYMVGLTDAELTQHGIVPGRTRWPNVVDGSRPAANRTDRPVSQRQHQQQQAWLQNDCIGTPAEY